MLAYKYVLLKGFSDDLNNITAVCPLKTEKWQTIQKYVLLSFWKYSWI